MSAKKKNAASTTPCGVPISFQWPPNEIGYGTPEERSARAIMGMVEAALVLAELQNGSRELSTEEAGMKARQCAEYAIEWMVASATKSSKFLPIHLWSLNQKTKRCLEELAVKRNPWAIELSGLRNGIELQLEKSLKEFRRSQRGGRKIDWDAAENRAVFALFKEITHAREGLKMILEKADRPADELIGSLHPTAAAIARLEDLSPDTWEEWHEVGNEVKKDLSLEIDSDHLREAWERWGKMALTVPLTHLIFTR